MKKYLITFRSVTFAQKAERIVKRSGIHCMIRRTPKALTDRQCGYCLQLRSWDPEAVLAQLRSAQVQFGKVYGQEDNGEFEEMVL